MKEFPIKERVRFTFRWEMYNAFNHTQFLSVDNTARFDAAGKQTNQRLGALIANRDPRVRLKPAPPLPEREVLWRRDRHRSAVPPRSW